MTDNDGLATFEDRYTMRHTRIYPHAIADVFDAVTRTDELNLWMLPICEVEPRPGGRCSFTWGGPRGEEMVGVVSEFERPTLVHYGLDGSFIRFELTAIDDSTTELVLRHQIHRPGATTLDLWPPDVVQGFHVFADRLGEVLDGTRDLDEAKAQLAAAEAGDGGRYHLSLPPEIRDTSTALIARYRAHILSACPAE